MSKSITVTPEEVKNLRLTSKAHASVKYDGIQARWDGKTLTTKTWVKINAPEWFLRELPSFPATGELWMGNNTFQLCQKTILSGTPENTAWNQVFFMIFEKPLGTRLKLDSSPMIQMIVKYNGSGHDIARIANRVISKGGEGLVIIDRGMMIKVKSRPDAEAIVTGHKRQGKRLKSIIVCAAGISFCISSGLSEDDRENPPKIGDQITYSHMGLTDSGKPRHAVFMRSRCREV